MVHHGADNKAMVWESSDKLAADSRLNLGKVEDHRPSVVDLPTVESVGHMQRPKYPTTYIETLENHLKSNIASGMFAMGDAFKNAGLLLAPILTVFLGCLCVFNQHTLVNCANKMREKRKLNYYPNFDDTVELSFDAGPPLFHRHAKHGRNQQFEFGPEHKSPRGDKTSPWGKRTSFSTLTNSTKCNYKLTTMHENS
ncbi:hypothetical protein J6590_042594 [Homalodisca vitripennis]|nr:hypothetical protein J6590_042594 [Homalodisca vitripennis]